MNYADKNNQRNGFEQVNLKTDPFINVSETCQ